MSELRAPQEPGIFQQLINSAVPTNLRTLMRYRLHNFFSLWPSNLSEESFNDATLQVLSEAIKNARAKGKNSVHYDDYPNLANGLTARQYVTHDSPERRAVYGEGIKGAPQFASDLYDPVLGAVTTLGKFNFKPEPDGTITITDTYDFGGVGDPGGPLDIYQLIRSSIPKSEDGQGMPVNIRIDPSRFAKNDASMALADTTPPIPTPRPKLQENEEGLMSKLSSLFSSDKNGVDNREAVSDVPLPTPRPSRESAVESYSIVNEMKRLLGASDAQSSERVPTDKSSVPLPTPRPKTS